MLFSDRRSGVLHDIGMNAAPDHDPTQGLAGWASAHRDTQRGLAAAIVPAYAGSTGMPRTQTIVPGGPGPRPLPAKPASPYDFKPSITSPAEQRGLAGRVGGQSRVSSWSNGSAGTAQTVTPGTPLRGVRSQNVLPSFVGQKLKVGPSFAQRVRRAVRMP